MRRHKAHSLALFFWLIAPSPFIAGAESPRAATQNEESWLAPIAASYVERPFGAANCLGEGRHQGADLVTKKETGIVAPAAGLVIVAAKSDPFFPKLKNLIAIDHGDGTTTVFANLDERLVKAGQSVRRGQRIAMTRGPSDGTQQHHTHVELIYQGKAIDPFKRLPYVFFDLQLPPSKSAYKNAPE